MSSAVSVDDITKITHRFAVKWEISVRQLSGLFSSGGDKTTLISNVYKFKNIEHLEFSYHLFHGEYFQMRVKCKTDMPIFQEDALILFKDRIYRVQCNPTNTIGRLIFDRDVLTENSFEEDKATIHCIMSIPAQVKAVILDPKEDKYASNVVECESVVTYPNLHPYGYDALNKFEYGSEIPDFSVKTALSMISEAQKRHKPIFKALCLEYLMDNLTPENVSEVLKQAVYVDATDLTRKCVDFLIEKCKITSVNSENYL